MRCDDGEWEGTECYIARNINACASVRRVGRAAYDVRFSLDRKLSDSATFSAGAPLNTTAAAASEKSNERKNEFVDGDLTTNSAARLIVNVIRNADRRNFRVFFEYTLLPRKINRVATKSRTNIIHSFLKRRANHAIFGYSRLEEA